jgi:hypothetical protein
MTRIISIVGGLQPSTPTIGTATAGDTTASVAFTPSTYIGKGTITYTATSSPSGITATSATSPITVTGLSNGTAYTFTVTGTTNYGVTSLASASSNSITPVIGDLGSMFAIATTTVGPAGASSITFSSIPSTYTHLQIRSNARANRATYGADTMKIIFNADTGANYSHHQLVGDGSSAYAGAAANQNYIQPTDSVGTNNGPGAGNVGCMILDIFDYANTNKYKTARMLTGVDVNGTVASFGGVVGFSSGLWRNTNAITSITFSVLTGIDFLQYSEFSLYGIKGA